jgi:tetrahydromethanopterin S-methyltransferase subunit A
MPSRMENFGFFLTRTFASTKAQKKNWPFIPGKYFVNEPTAPVAVTTLGSVDLAGEVAKSPPDGLCIVGKVETENIGIEKIIKNILSNPGIRYLVCAGAEPPKHLTGATITALFENGIDDAKKIIGSPGMRPVLPNTSVEEIKAFRDQVEPIDMIGCMDVASIHAKIDELASAAPKSTAHEFIPPDDLEEQEAVDRVIAEGMDPMRIKLDKAGYFVINIENDTLLVEHYSYKEKLLRIIEGQDARSIYLTIVRNDWVTKLDHAAYIGKELTKAELSMQHGFEFTQDGG